MTKHLCFTGHRPDKLGGYGVNSIQDWVRNRLADAIYRAFHNDYTGFICGGALGSDWIAAEEVLDARENYPEIRLILAIPFEGYNSKWPLSAIEVFDKKIRANANKIITVSQPPYSTQKMMLRNEWMVDNSDSVIAIWNGTIYGGTADTVEYAQSKKKRIYRIDPIAKTEGWMP